MKRVTLTAADVDNLRKILPKETAPQTFYHEEMQVDAVSVGLARPSASADPRSNTYTLGFRCGDSEYVIVVRPTVHHVPSITLDVIKRVAGQENDAEFASYTVLNDTVTTLKGKLSGLPKGQITATTGDVVTANMDLPGLLGHLTVQ